MGIEAKAIRGAEFVDDVRIKAKGAPLSKVATEWGFSANYFSSIRAHNRIQPGFFKAMCKIYDLNEDDYDPDKDLHPTPAGYPAYDGGTGSGDMLKVLNSINETLFSINVTLRSIKAKVEDVDGKTANVNLNTSEQLIAIKNLISELTK